MRQAEYRFHVDSAEEIRVDKYLSDKLPDISRSRIKSCIESGDVVLDGKTVDKAGTKAKPGSIVELIVTDRGPGDLIPEALSLVILFENDDVIVIDKPSGMVVHPGAGTLSGTVVNGLLAHFPPIRSVGENERPGVIHRLDKETSGVLVFAKTDKAYRWLVKQFKSQDAKKTYLALVDGHPPTPTGRIEAPIERDSKIRTKMTVGLRGHGKEAVTEYFQLQSYKKHTYLEAHPITGRTHQIRVHLSYIGTPVVGDTLYGHRRPSMDLDRFFLHARSLAIRLPGDRVARTFEASLPDELARVLNSLSQEKR